jgi:hypothetical protein
MSADYEDEHKVGYGKPPAQTRFKKGQSGNPSGKRKGSGNVRSQLEKLFGTPIAVTDSGRRRRLLPEVILMKKLVNEAAKGNIQAIKLFFAVRQQYGGLDGSLRKHAEPDYSAAAKLFTELCSRSDDPTLEEP